MLICKASRQAGPFIVTLNIFSTMWKNVLLIGFWICLAFWATGQDAAQLVSIGHRYQMDSKVLEEERSYIVSLPPSYYSSTSQRYPVLYLIDGDYNFPYCSGLIEQLSVVSSLIPEMIIVGVSDKGQANYINNLTLPPPNKAEDPKVGRAMAFMDFMGTELKPTIEKQYRTAGLDILYGHSIGGLFTVTTLLHRPELFDAYIAVSASLWWNEYTLNQEAAKLLKAQDDTPKFLYLTLGNEEQMGIQELVGMLDKERPAALDWTFTHLPEESHGSVGVASLDLAMRKFFKGWRFKREEFLAFKDFGAISAHYQKLSKKWTYNFPLSAELLANAVSYYSREGQLDQVALMQTEIEKHFPLSVEGLQNEIASAYFKAKKYKEAEQTYLANLEQFPQSILGHHGLAKVYEAQKEGAKGLQHFEQAVKLAEQQQARQWLKNFLMAEWENLKNTTK